MCQKVGQRIEAGLQGVSELRQASTQQPLTRGPTTTKLLIQVASFLRKPAVFVTRLTVTFLHPGRTRKSWLHGPLLPGYPRTLPSFLLNLSTWPSHWPAQPPTCVALNLVRPRSDFSMAPFQLATELQEP